MGFAAISRGEGGWKREATDCGKTVARVGGSLAAGGFVATPSTAVARQPPKALLSRPATIALSFRMPEYGCQLDHSPSLCRKQPRPRATGHASLRGTVALAKRWAETHLRHPRCSSTAACRPQGMHALGSGRDARHAIDASRQCAASFGQLRSRRPTSRRLSRLWADNLVDKSDVVVARWEANRGL